MGTHPHIPLTGETTPLPPDTEGTFLWKFGGLPASGPFSADAVIAGAPLSYSCALMAVVEPLIPRPPPRRSDLCFTARPSLNALAVPELTLIARAMLNRNKKCVPPHLVRAIVA